MKDMHTLLSAAVSLVPAVQSATLKGGYVDLQGFNAVELVVSTGAIAGDGLYVMSIQESDTTDDEDFDPVAADDLLGELPTALEASSVYTVGYIGKRRYVRAVITKTSGTSIGAGAAFVLGLPSIAPVA